MDKKINFKNVVNLTRKENNKVINNRLVNLNSTGFYIIPISKNIVNSGKVLVNVLWVNNNGEQIILISDLNRNLIDLTFDGSVFVRKTKDGESPNWGKYPIPGILSDCYIDGNVFDWTSFRTFSEEIFHMIEDISEKERDVAIAIYMVVNHIHGTYSDKYAKGQDIIDTKKMLYDKERGDFLNIYQVNRYLQRYLTKGSEKSHLVKDIEKAIHYLIFEISRRIKMNDVNEFEPKF